MMRLITLFAVILACMGFAAFAPGTAQADHFAIYGPQYQIACNDQHDNDGDGKIDYGDGYMNDPGCSSFSDNDEGGATGGTAPQCDDQWDNDNDGYFNMQDPDCSSPSDNTEAGSGGGGGGGYAACGDTLDNDGDGQTDYPNDPGCSGYGDTSEKGTTVCDDGISNDDGDSLIDYPADPGCYAPGDTDEGNVAQCGDGVDNDADGKVDTGGVMNWNTGQYYPADDGCENTWDGTEFAEYQPPPATAAITGSVEFIREDTDYAAAQEPGIPLPMPPASGFTIDCKSTIKHGFDRITSIPSYYNALFTFQCDKVITIADVSYSVEARVSGTGSPWTRVLLRNRTLYGKGPYTIVGGNGLTQTYHRFSQPMSCNNTSVVYNIEYDWRIKWTAFASGVLANGTVVSGNLPPGTSTTATQRCRPVGF